MGYHTKEIKRGVFGEPSKIREEFEEFEDALTQRNPVMAIIELSDLVGAIDGYIRKFNLTIDDLVAMKEATHRAFMDGTRKPRL